MSGNAHRVTGSATKSAVACPRHNPGNAVVLQLSDNCKGGYPAPFQVGGWVSSQSPHPVKIIDYGNRKF